MHIAAEPVELGDDHWTLATTHLGERRNELWPAVKGVGALAGLDLDELSCDLALLGGGEAPDGFTLRVEADARGPWRAVETRK
jgi:hypothetical protein